MADQHPVLTMHGNEEFRAGEGQHQLFVLLATMAGDVDALPFAIDNLGAHHHQSIDGVDHGYGIARNRTGGENDRVG